MHLTFHTPLSNLSAELRDGSRNWKHYIFQGLLIVIAMLMVFRLLDWQHLGLVSSIGGTIFNLFATPTSTAASTKNVIVGHLIGMLIAFGCSFFPHSEVVSAIAVGLSVVLLAITRTLHPPSSGTVLGVTSKGFSPEAALSLAVSVLILVVIYRLLKPYLKDLF